MHNEIYIKLQISNQNGTKCPSILQHQIKAKSARPYCSINSMLLSKLILLFGTLRLFLKKLYILLLNVAYLKRVIHNFGRALFLLML
jgi:hypothetical protein